MECVARPSKSLSVALLAEGVDRNTLSWALASLRDKSPSSRRAWIEIELLDKVTGLNLVALLAEGVDRNYVLLGEVSAIRTSPSSRRAWIEIEKT